MNNCKPFLIIIICMINACGHAQTFIRGKVVDNNTNGPVQYANLSLGASSGTASDENGVFQLKVERADLHGHLHISCVGYSSLRLSIDSLIKVNDHTLEIALKPFTTVFSEIVVQANRVTPDEIVVDAIKAIPGNYTSKPFNMEFYSKIIVKNSDKNAYVVEEIIDTYRAGYVEGSENRSKVIQKRTTGDDPTTPLYDKRRNMNYFAYERIPFFNIFLCDMIGVGPKYDYTVFNQDYISKLEFHSKGLSIFEDDTVYVIDYAPRRGREARDGTLYISSRNLAILKHTRQLGEITLEISYRKWGDSYFPYFIKTLYPANGKDRRFEVIFEAYIRNVRTKDVIPYDVSISKGWHLDDVSYDAQYWEANYPVQSGG